MSGLVDPTFLRSATLRHSISDDPDGVEIEIIRAQREPGCEGAAFCE